MATSEDNQVGFERTAAENLLLTQRIADIESERAAYNETYARVMLEQCAPDERHCACVPHLRERIAELESGLRNVIQSKEVVMPIELDEEIIELLKSAGWQK